jgi:hypothetical protein
MILEAYLDKKTEFHTFLSYGKRYFLLVFLADIIFSIMVRTFDITTDYLFWMDYMENSIIFALGGVTSSFFGVLFYYFLPFYSVSIVVENSKILESFKNSYILVKTRKTAALKFYIFTSFLGLVQENLYIYVLANFNQVTNKFFSLSIFTGPILVLILILIFQTLIFAIFNAYTLTFYVQKKYG